MSCDIGGHTTKILNGIKVHQKKKHKVPQIDGNVFISEETLTAMFLTIDAKGEYTSSDLADLNLEPPITFYHIVKGIGVYHSTSELVGVKDKYYSYKFKDGSIYDT